MAHEFIAKNGIISQGNIVISGSITTTGAITVSGSIASSSYSLSSSYASSSTSASYAISSSYAYNSTLYNGTASTVFATTGSNNLTGDQHITSVADASAFAATASIYTDGGLQVIKNAYFSSSMFIKGDLTVYGTQSIAYITSSQLNISTNVITVNTATPSVRFGGLSVYDSGSTGTGATGSLFWDSQNNHWIYNRESGSTYGGGMLISGPRRVNGNMGDEQGTTACYLTVGQGGDHITSSMIYHDSSTTCIQTALIGTSTACFAGTVCSNGNILVGGTGTPNYLPKFTGASTIGNSLIYETGGNILINTTTNSTDTANLQIAGVTPINDYNAQVQVRTSTLSANDISRIAFFHSTHGSAYIQSKYESTSYASLSFGTRGGGSIVERMIISSTGNLGLGVTPSAWQNTFGSTAFQLYGSYIYGYRDTNLLIGNNAYYDGTWKYYASSIGATKFNMGNGAYDWSIAPSGTAGNAITFTQAMTLTASGRLLIGTPTEASYMLDVNGTGRFSGDVTMTSAGSTTITNSGTTPILNMIRNNNASSPAAQINFKTSQGTTRWQIATNSATGTGFEINEGDGINNRFYIATSGAATFSSSVTAGGLITVNKINEGLILTSGANTDASYMSTRANNSTGWMIMGSQGTTSGYIQSGTGANESAITTVGAYALALGTNQVERMRITSDGNVGIGTTSPQGALEVVGLSYFTRSGQSLLVNPNYGAAGTHTQLQVVGNMALAFATNGDNERMRITSGGNVGIGCTSPSGKLQVANSSTQYALYTAAGNLELHSPETNLGYVRLGSAYNLNGVYGSCGLNYIVSGTSNHIFYTTDSATERMRITSTGIACFACQICTPQSSITSGYDQGDLLMISNKLDSNRININNNVPIAAFRICKGGGQASSASYSLLGGHLYISFNLRYTNGYDTSQSIVYPFLIGSSGQNGPVLFLGTPNCITGFDNSSGATSFGITLCGVSDTTATMIVCANNTQRTIEGSSSITISMVASRTAILSNEMMNLYKL